MTKQSSTHTCPVVCSVLIITTTNTADWPWASGQLFADVSSSPNHMSIIFSSECPMVWRQILTEDQVSCSISLSKPYHSILGRNLDCHSKVSLQFYPLPWWAMYLEPVASALVMHWAGQTPSQSPAATVPQHLSQCVCACHRVMLVWAHQDLQSSLIRLSAYLNLFSHPSCDTY